MSTFVALVRTVKNHRIILAAFGLITAAVIVFSQLFLFQAADYCEKQVKTEQQDQNGSDSSEVFFIAAPSTSILSASHIEIDHEFSFVLELLFQPEQNDSFEIPTSLSLGKLFETLFSVIISPNAP